MLDQEVIADPRQGHILARYGTQYHIGIVTLRKGEDTSLQNVE